MDEMSFTVSAGSVGLRLDKWLSAQMEGVTRQHVQRLLDDGHVRKGGVVISQRSAKVRAGECYSVHIPQPSTPDIVAEAIALDIVYEDAHLLVINKAAGMVVHPAAGVVRGTLVNALLHHCGDDLSGIGGVARPGIVHRLDKDTSGLMLVAKHDAAHQHLSAQLQARSLSRIYHAYCWSALQPSQGVIDAPIARCPRDRKKMAEVEGGKPARTHYRTLRVFQAVAPSGRMVARVASLVECRLESGRTHQIRVHLSQRGCGLIGDPVYGAPTSRRLSGLSSVLCDEAHAAFKGFARQALHATHIRFIHPHTQEPMHFDASCPPDMVHIGQICAQMGGADAGIHDADFI